MGVYMSLGLTIASAAEYMVLVAKELASSEGHE
jgi:hypothetical protein